MTEGCVVTCNLPLDAITLQEPEDGYPSKDDWVTTLLSFMFSGSRLLT